MRTAKIAKQALLVSLIALSAQAFSPRVHAQTEPAAAEASAADSVDALFTEADKLIANVDFDGAIVILERVAKRRGLTHEQLVRVTRLRAQAHAVTGHDQEARELFLKLLALDPEFKIDTNLSPKVQAPYFEARGFWTAQTVKPGIELAATVRRNADSRIRVTLRDPLHLARQIQVAHRWDAGDYTVKTLPAAAAATVDVRAPAAAAHLETFVRAVDENEAILFESGGPDNPTLVPVPAEPPPAPAVVARPEERPRSSLFASPVFWTVAGLLVVGGATAIYFGARDPGTTPATSERLTPTLTCAGQACF